MCAICGGVISQSKFNSDPWAYMMCWIMDDDKFKEYQLIEDKKEKHKFFEENAISMI
jgi:hypothetical protein